MTKANRRAIQAHTHPLIPRLPTPPAPHSQEDGTCSACGGEATPAADGHLLICSKCYAVLGKRG